VGLCSIKTSIHIRRGVVHDHSGGVYPVPYRTRKSRPPASLFVLWYESPREGVSLCLFHSSLPGPGRPLGRPGPTFSIPHILIQTAVRLVHCFPSVRLREVDTGPLLPRCDYGAESI